MEENTLTANNHKDMISGFMFIIFGTSFAYMSTRYDLGTAVMMGPGYFPFGLGLLLAGIGGVVLISSFAKTAEREGLAPMNLRIVFGILGSMVLFGFILEPLGLVVGIFVLVLCSSFAGHEFDPKRTLAAAALLSVLCVGIFVYALRVQIPIWPSFLTQP